MDYFYYLGSFLRIVPRKTAQYFYNYYYGINGLPAKRIDDNQTMTVKMWNHITNVCLEPTEIVPGIYLGNAYNACNYQLLKRLNIKIIVNVSIELPNFYEIYNEEFKYLKVPIRDDSEHYLTNQWISGILDFLDLNGPYDEEHGLLIHCYMGSSRSASIVILYLIHRYGYNLKTAYELVRNKRPIVNVNTNFIQNIQEFFNDEPLILENIKQIENNNSQE